MKHNFHSSFSFRVFLMVFTIAFLSLSYSACSTRPSSSALEAKASARTLNWLDSKYGLIQDKEIQAYLNKVLTRLAIGTSTASLAIKIPEKESPVLTTWRLFVITSSEPNAFAIGGGSIVVSNSLIRQCRSEAELASIIAHEMSHQMLGHTRDALLSSLSAKSSPGYSYSLKDESKADLLGLLLLDLARYDVRASISALSIGYRRKQHLVSGRAKRNQEHRWLEIRAQKLREAIGDSTQSKRRSLGTQNTRGFNKMQRRIRTLRD